MNAGQHALLPIKSLRLSFSIGALVLASVLTLNGCYAYRVQAPNHPGVTDPRSKTIWSLAWGLAQQQPAVDCHGEALAEVTVKSNLLFDIFTVATLGFASPKRVEWRCSHADPGTGTFGADSSRGGGR